MPSLRHGNGLAGLHEGVFNSPASAYAQVLEAPLPESVDAGGDKGVTWGGGDFIHLRRASLMLSGGYGTYRVITTGVINRS